MIVKQIKSIFQLTCQSKFLLSSSYNLVQERLKHNQDETSFKKFIAVNCFWQNTDANNISPDRIYFLI